MAAHRNDGERKSLVGSLVDRAARFTEHGIRLNHEAATRGLTFQHDKDNKTQTSVAMMDQSIIGGVVVVDDDLEDWPDLYFSGRHQELFNVMTNQEYLVVEAK